MSSAVRAPSADGVHSVPSAVGEHSDKKSTVTRKVRITRTSSMVKITRTGYIDTGVCYFLFQFDFQLEPEVL